MNSLRVVLADDNEDFRNEFAEYLSKQPGIELIGVAKDGFEAISFVHLLSPDLILLDISMPELNGFEVAKQLMENSTDTKIIFVTIHEEKTYLAMAKLLGVDGCVCKSSLKQDLPILLKKVRRVEKDSA